MRRHLVHGVTPAMGPGEGLPHDALIDVLAVATGPSRAIDDAVTAWLGDVDPAAWAASNPPDHGRPWHDAVPGGAPGTARIVADWSCDIRATIALVRFVLPGWWWSMGDCSVSADSTLGPDNAGPDADLLTKRDRTFDEGFQLDVRKGHVCLSMIENLVGARMARDTAREVAVDGGAVPTSSKPRLYPDDRRLGIGC